MNDIPVLRMLPAQRAQAVEVLVSAFLDDPGYQYVFPNPQRREQSLRRYWDAVIALHQLCGEVYVTSDLSGVAYWFPPIGTPAALWYTLRTGFATLRALLSFDGDDRKRLVALAQYADAAKKSAMSTPCYTLSLLGVRPECQGQGIGSALMRHRLSQPGADAVGWYLDTDTERNVAFYRKHDFTTVHEGKIPGTDINLIGMFRRPTG